MLPLLTLLACAPVPSLSVYMGCDGTGASPEDVCTEELLVRGALKVPNTNLILGGGRVVIATSAGSFGDTPLYTFPVGAAEPGRELEAQRGLRAEVTKIAIPRDVPGGRARNQSDVLSMIAKLGREARNNDDREDAELILATDFRAIGNGFNFETAVPTVDAVVEKYATPDFTMFRSILICGLHSRGTTDALIKDLDAFVTDYMATGRGPRPEISSSCRDPGSLPPVPPELDAILPEVVP